MEVDKIEKENICVVQRLAAQPDCVRGLRIKTGRGERRKRAESGAKYRLLSVKQYLAVYKASAKDGYRVNTRGKKDAEKIALLEKLV